MFKNGPFLDEDQFHTGYNLNSFAFALLYRSDTTTSCFRFVNVFGLHVFVRHPYKPVNYHCGNGQSPKQK